MATGIVFYDTADIDKVVAFYSTDTDAPWAGMTKLVNPSGVFTVGVDIRHHKIVADTITEMSAGEKTSHPLPVKDKTQPSGLDHPAVRAATTAALPAHTRSGNVLTASANGALPAQDGVTLVLQDRLLVKDEGGGTDLENGVYLVTQVGDGSNPWILRRAVDANVNAEVWSCLGVFVEEGTVNAGRLLVLTTANPITVNTTALTFETAGGSMPMTDASGTVVWSARVSGDSNNRVQISADGRVSWGPGNAAVDTYMSRSATGVVAFGEVDGVAAHAAYFYRTRSASGANYERIEIVWDSTIPTIRNVKGGTGGTRNMVVQSDGGLNLRSGGATTRWQIDVNGHLVSGPADNAYDAGGSSNQIRNIYFGTQTLGPNGAFNAPTYSHANDPDTGSYLRTVGAWAVTVGSTQMLELTVNEFTFRNTMALGWTSGAPSATADLLLERDAADTLAQKHGGNAQEFRVYGTTTGPKYAFFKHDATDGIVEAQTGDLRLRAAGNVRFGTHSAIGAETVTGFITIKDDGGASRKLAVVS